MSDAPVNPLKAICEYGKIMRSLQQPRECIIVHGCPSTPEDDSYNQHWMTWVASKLVEPLAQVQRPMMPEPWAPNYEAFKAEFERVLALTNPDNKLVLVGHSCGCSFLVRWLGETTQQVKRLILVAPWKMSEPNDPGRDVYYGFDIDPTIADRVEEIVYFTSGDEHADGVASLELFRDALGGEVISLPGHGHFTYEDMGTQEFPELVDEVLR